MGLNDQRYEEVQDSIDEQYQEDGEEDLAEYVNSLVVPKVHSSICGIKIISIHHCEESVEGSVKGRELSDDQTHVNHMTNTVHSICKIMNPSYPLPYHKPSKTQTHN